MSWFGRYIGPNTSIGRWKCYYKLYSNIENADILLTQCPEKRRKQAYIYAKIRTGSVQNCLLCIRVNISADIYTRLFGTRLIGTRPIGTRLIGTLKIDRVQLERVSLARHPLTLDTELAWK